jgi:hypothetical protein
MKSDTASEMEKEEYLRICRYFDSMREEIELLRSAVKLAKDALSDVAESKDDWSGSIAAKTLVAIAALEKITKG